jgi:hypothetical protein
MPKPLQCPSVLLTKGHFQAQKSFNIMQQDTIVMKKMAFSAAAGLLFAITAVFTTMLDLSIVWRNIWLGFCLGFFLLALIGVFILCGDLNSEHSEPEDAPPKA